MQKKITILLVISILFIQTQCSIAFPKVKPDIKTSPILTPEQWSENNIFITKDDPVINWWDKFNDTQLSGYIKDLADFNYDLQTAVARIQEAKALRAGAKSNLYPQIDANTKYSRYQFFAATKGATGKSLDLVNAGFDTSWEIDLFGKNRWEVIAATEKIEESIELKRAILISLISELASNYMELRGNQAQLANLRKNIELQATNLKLEQSRYKIGLSPEVEVIRAKSLLTSLNSQAPNLEAAIKASVYNISVLTGRNPEMLLCELLPEKPLPAPPVSVSVGLPADLILRRPDIRQSQRGLASVLASAGAAKADLYPSIKINGSIGLQDIKITDLTNITGGLWSIMPAVNWKIFDRRILKANFDANKARTRSADTELRQTVLEALKEVEININYLQASKKTEEDLLSATISSNQAYNMINKAYQIGLKNQTEVLDAEKTYINNKAQLISSKTQINLQTINLYKALGGGWQYF